MPIPVNLFMLLFKCIKYFFKTGQFFKVRTFRHFVYGGADIVHIVNTFTAYLKWELD